MKLAKIGSLASLAICILVLGRSTRSIDFFFDLRALLLVLGGTLALSMVCFPPRALRGFAIVCVKKFLVGHAPEYEAVMSEILVLARLSREDAQALKTARDGIKLPFLRDAFDLFARGGVPDDVLWSTLRRRADTFAARYGDDVEMLRVIAKFPLMLGVLGGILSLINPLQALGPADSLGRLGPALAASLLAPIYGLLFSTFLLIPLGEMLVKLNHEDATIREMVMEGVRLIFARTHPLMIENHLKSFLLPSERRNISLARYEHPTGSP
jgi:chemotaxis protein MotA